MAIASPLPTDAASPRSQTQTPRLAYIEGLRALAALWVVFSHMWISQFGAAAHTGPLGLASNWLLYSHLAVDVFIVLSGYCLYLPVRRDGGLLKPGTQSFLRRRARRILPPMYFALAFAVAISLGIEHLDSRPLQIDVRALGVNLLLLQDLILRDNVFNGPLWSVAVEWRLSLVFPFMVWGLRRVGRPILLLTTAIIGYGVTASMFRYRPDLLMSCPWYLLLFAMGLCAASLAPGSRELSSEARLTNRRWWRFGIALSAGLLILLLWEFPVTIPTADLFGRHMSITDAAAGTLATLLLIGLRDSFDRPGAVMPAVLSWKPLDVLGRFSYSLYLTHEPLLRVLVRLMNFWPALETASPLLRFGFLVVVGTPLLIGLAFLFFLCCERPFMSTRRVRHQDKPVF